MYYKSKEKNCINDPCNDSHSEARRLILRSPINEDNR